MGNIVDVQWQKPDVTRARPKEWVRNSSKNRDHETFGSS